MNSINLTGRLTQDPELRALPSGDPVCKLRLAVDGLAPSRETGYINVTCFGNSGEAAARVLAKGWLVAVNGRLEYQVWETREGAKRHDYGIVGNVEFLAAPRPSDTETVESEEQEREELPAAA
jgi:single-strand DNA-binding protein